MTFSEWFKRNMDGKFGDYPIRDVALLRGWCACKHEILEILDENIVEGCDKQFIDKQIIGKIKKL